MSLEQAIVDYLTDTVGGTAPIHELRDTIVTPLIVNGRSTSEALSEFRRALYRLLRYGGIIRVGRGQYAVTGARYPDVSKDRGRDTRPLPPDLRANLSGPEGMSYFLSPVGDAAGHFESVTSLARSSRFLVQHDLSDIDLKLLEELSL